MTIDPREKCVRAIEMTKLKQATRGGSRLVAAIGLVVALAAATTASAAEITVLTTRAMNHVLMEIASAFEHTSEHKVRIVLAPPNEIKTRIMAGETVDIAMSGGSAIEDLVRQGKIAADSKIVLARVGIAIAVRSGAPKPDISSVEAFKRALLAAKSVVYTDPAVGGTSGIHIVKIIERLGIVEEMKTKSILNKQAATLPSAEIVARGDAELGIQLMSEILSVKGAELVGPLPAELQAFTVLSAGMVQSTKVPEAAKALFRFLTTPAAASAIRAAGMEPGSS